MLNCRGWTGEIFCRKTVQFSFVYTDERASLFTCLPRQHLELILVLMDFHTFSFSLADSMGKRLNTSTFNAGSFVTSSCCLLWVLLVYAVAQLFQDNEERQKFKSTPKPLFFPLTRCLPPLWICLELLMIGWRLHWLCCPRSSMTGVLAFEEL